jgi:hypothetical protein
LFFPFVGRLWFWFFVQMEPDKVLDEACQRGEYVGMRTGRALVLIATLAVQSVCVFGGQLCLLRLQ